MASMEVAEEGGGEGYFASVSDMMVGILFIFLLLLTVFALNLRDAEQEQKVKYEEYLQAQERAKAAEQLAKEAELKARREAAIANAAKIENERFRTLLLDAVSQLEKDLKDRETARSQLLLSLQSSLGARGVSVSIDPESGILRLPEDLLFKTGESTIRTENLPRVQTLAQVLSDILPCYVAGSDSAKCSSGVTPILETVLVEGHTDRQAFRSTVVPPPPAAPVAPPPARASLFSSAASTPAPLAVISPPRLVVLNDSELRNDRLSTERALNVFKEVKKAQPSLESLRNAEKQSLLGFSGYGPRRPLPDALGSTQADYQKNRRIDLRFVLSARTSDELSRLQVQIRDALGSGK
jgi:flagellar motor protein MotB